MKVEVADRDNRVFSYNENIWTGKRSLKIDGKAMKRRTKKVFELDDENKTLATVKGSFISGIKLLLSSGGGEIVICKNKWYEWIFIMLPFLNMALGVLCGAIGGGLSALFSFLAAVFNAAVLRSEIFIVFKILICLVLAAASFFAWFLIFVAILGGLNQAFPGIFA
jgi:hypothetical protein